jgi:microcystin-dependent protein
MAEPFIAEVKLFAGTFAPRGWAFCNGQLLAIAQNTALFSLLGTTFGGNGQTTFALPDLRARMAMSAGQGPGLPNYLLGQVGGAAEVTLLAAQMPAHNHSLGAAATASTGAPSNAVALAATATAKVYRGPTNLTTMALPLSSTGGSQPHANRQPYLGVNFIIALQGIYPSRN